MIINHRGGNGGGGGYVLPVASQSTLGGVKVGEGLSISSGGTLSVSGGSSEQNYVIVNSLSEVSNPFEGLKVYVKSGTTVEEWQGWSLSASTIQEDYVAHAMKGSTDVSIYKSNTNFFWGWENDGQLHIKEENDWKCAYLADNTNGVFNIWFPDFDNWELQNISAGVETGETSYNVPVSWPSAQYVYNGETFENISDLVFILDKMSQPARADFIAYFNTLSEEQKIAAHVYMNNVKCSYDRTEDGKAHFLMHSIDNGYGYNVINVDNFWVKPDGSFDGNSLQSFAVPMNMYVDLASGHTLSDYNNEGYGIEWVRRAAIDGKCNITATLWDSTQETRPQSHGIAYTNNVYLEPQAGGITKWTIIFLYNGQQYKGVWTSLEFGATLVSWDAS